MVILPNWWLYRYLMLYCQLPSHMPVIYPHGLVSLLEFSNKIILSYLILSYLILSNELLLKWIAKIQITINIFLGLLYLLSFFYLSLKTKWITTLIFYIWFLINFESKNLIKKGSQQKWQSTNFHKKRKESQQSTKETVSKLSQFDCGHFVLRQLTDLNKITIIALRCYLPNIL